MSPVVEIDQVAPNARVRRPVRHAVTAADRSDPAGTADGALVARARQGDHEAFAELHDRHAPMVHSILLTMVHTSDAEDLTQDVFVKALVNLGKLRDVDAFAPWLVTVARNRARDHHRRQRQHRALPEEIPVDAPPTAEALEVVETIRSLPEAYRESLMLRLVAGMSGPEIAARTGLTSGSVRVNLHRGMKLLKSKLGVEDRS